MRNLSKGIIGCCAIEVTLYAWGFQKYKQFLFLIAIVCKIFMFAKLLRCDKVFILFNAILSLLLCFVAYDFLEFNVLEINTIYVISLILCQFCIAICSFHLLF